MSTRTGVELHGICYEKEEILKHKAIHLPDILFILLLLFVRVFLFARDTWRGSVRKLFVCLLLLRQ